MFELDLNIKFPLLRLLQLLSDLKRTTYLITFLTLFLMSEKEVYFLNYMPGFSNFVIPTPTTKTLDFEGFEPVAIVLFKQILCKGLFSKMA